MSSGSTSSTISYDAGPGGRAGGGNQGPRSGPDGRDYVADSVVTAVDPGTSYRFEGSGTIGGLKGGRRVDPDGDAAAIFTYTIELEPHGWMRLLRPVLGSLVRSGLKRDLQTLKGLLEARA